MEKIIFNFFLRFFIFSKFFILIESVKHKNVFIIFLYIQIKRVSRLKVETRAVHKSSQLKFGSEPYSTRLGRVTFDPHSTKHTSWINVSSYRLSRSNSSVKQVCVSNWAKFVDLYEFFLILFFKGLFSPN